MRRCTRATSQMTDTCPTLRGCGAGGRICSKRFSTCPNALMDETTLTVRERAILACAIAANLGDSYCAQGWGARLASESSPTIAAAVLQGMKHSQLSARDNALATWAHKVVGDPN